MWQYPSLPPPMLGVVCIMQILVPNLWLQLYPTRESFITTGFCLGYPLALWILRNYSFFSFHLLCPVSQLWIAPNPEHTGTMVSDVASYLAPCREKITKRTIQLFLKLRIRFVHTCSPQLCIYPFLTHLLPSWAAFYFQPAQRYSSSIPGSLTIGIACGAVRTPHSAGSERQFPYWLLSKDALRLLLAPLKGLRRRKNLEGGWGEKSNF